MTLFCRGDIKCPSLIHNYHEPPPLRRRSVLIGSGKNCQGFEQNKTHLPKRLLCTIVQYSLTLMLFNTSKLWHSYCLLTELTQNVLLFWLPVWDSGEKNEFWFLLTQREPITACWEGAELLQENNPRLCWTDWMWSIGPSAELNALCMGTVSHAAKHKNTIQTKSRLMARIITTQRFVSVCVCIFWLNNFYSALNFL